MNNDKIPLLDHGYLQFIEAWGTGIDGKMVNDFEVGIIEAARMSTAKGFLGWGPIHGDKCPTYDGYPCDCGGGKLGDEKLLAYLYEHKHNTPFEMAGMTIEVQAPIMVFREWHRHRTQSYNEMSARYTPLPDVNYIPTVERLLLNSKTNKQAGTIEGADELTEANARHFQGQLEEKYKHDEMLYQWALNAGVPKELARIHLPVGRYSRMRASANLRNWLAFLTLRMAPGAQWEIRQYANTVGRVIASVFPRTWALFDQS